MANLRIVPYNQHDQATLTTTGVSTATGFVVTDTQNKNRSRVYLASAAGTVTIRGLQAANMSASAFHMFRHNCHTGNIKVELFSDTAWTTSVLSTGTNAVDNVTDDSTYDWGIGNVDPLRSRSPYFVYFAATTYRSYEITLSSVTPAVQIARLFLGRAFEVSVNPNYGASMGFVDPNSTRSRSRGGSLYTNTAEPHRVFNYNLEMMDESDRAVWMDIMGYCGTSRDFAISLFPGDGTRMERDNTADCCFSALDPISRQVSYLSKTLQMEEV